jgi:hypothetical protein
VIFRFDATSVKTKATIAMAHIRAAIIGIGLGASGDPGAPGHRCTAEPDGFTDTLTFKVADPGTVTDGGLKLQLTPVGAPPQLNVTGAENPFVEFSATVKLVEPPTLIVADAGAIDAVNPDTTNTADTDCVVAPPVPTTLTE